MVRNFVLVGFFLGSLVNSINGQGCYVPGLNPPTYTSSPVYCTSETEFVIPNGDIVPESADVISCPSGQICADRPEICVSPVDAMPACVSSIRSCNNCNDSARYACVSANEFALCINKTPSAFKQTCPLATPICGYETTADPTSTNWPCLSQREFQSCTDGDCTLTSTAASTLSSTESSTSTSSSSIVSSSLSTSSSSSSASTTTTTVSPLAACNNQAGSFAVTTDPTCRSYIYCYLDGSTLRRMDYTCPSTYVFNSSVKKCVSSATYTCPYQSG